jgi:hypothetical protein
VLDKAAEFHKQYLIGRFKAENIAESQMNLPKQCAVQSDGRIMPVNSDQQESIMTVRRRALEQPRTFTLGRLQQSDGPIPKVRFLAILF